jgi:biopolymer transport protein TolR
MKRRRLSAMSDINITPLVDVLLILLVVIMLAMPAFVKRAPVDLPQTQFGGAPTPVASLRVYVDVEGRTFLDDKPVSRGDILERVGPGTSVELGADKAVTYEALMSLMTDLQAKNPRELSLLSY